MHRWRFIAYQKGNPAWNMAIDEAMMTAVRQEIAPPTIRLYGWAPAALSLGYFQKIKKAVELDRLGKYNVQLVRRLTGGRAVLHDREITYSVVAPIEYEHIPHSVAASHQWISQGLVAALQLLEVPVSSADKTPPNQQTSAACFDAPSAYEILVNGRKLVGSAQTRQQNILLQHGSLLLEPHDHLLFQLLKFSTKEAKDRLQRSFQQQATSLQEWRTPLPTTQVICQALQQGFVTGMGIELELGSLTAFEYDMATQLVQDKYAHEDWLYYR